MENHPSVDINRGFSSIASQRERYPANGIGLRAMFGACIASRGTPRANGAKQGVGSRMFDAPVIPRPP